MKTKKIGSIFALVSGVFLMVGIGLLIGGIISLYSLIQFRGKAEEIKGQITAIEWHRDSDGDKVHEVYVTYHYQGNVYEDIRLNSYSSGMYQGQEITLLCDPENPGRIRASSTFYLVPVILLGMGVIFSLIGGIFIITPIKGRIHEKKLRSTGITIYATVEQVVYNTSYSVNGQHPFVIYCTYKDDYKDVVYRFKSENIWTDPSGIYPAGSTIGVLVNQNDYSQYHVNVDEVHKKIIDYT